MNRRQSQRLAMFGADSPANLRGVDETVDVFEHLPVESEALA